MKNKANLVTDTSQRARLLAKFMSSEFDRLSGKKPRRWSRIPDKERDLSEVLAESILDHLGWGPGGWT